MKVVIDTNVLISGLYFGGVPARVVTAWTEGRVLLVVSPAMLHEHRRVGLELAKDRAPLIETLDALLRSSPCTQVSSTRRRSRRQCPRIRMMTNFWRPRWRAVQR